MTNRMLACAAMLACASGAAADVVFDTGQPGGFLGFYGYDVFVGQSVAVAFTPSQDMTLDSISPLMMSNDFDNAGRTYTLSLQTGAPGANNGVPSGTVLESWNMATNAVGWDPVYDLATSVSHPTLTGGVTYWIVAEGNEEPFVDPVWLASSDNGTAGPTVTAFNDLVGGSGWLSGVQEGGAPCVIVSATLVPTPGVLGLLGAAGVVATRRRRK